jgi:hypothetical protein
MNMNGGGNSRRAWADASDDEFDPPGFEKLGPEDWQSYYEEELLDAYYALVDGFKARGYPIFEFLTFHDFATFAYEKSSRWKGRK